MAEVTCPSCGQPVTVPEKKTGLWWGLGCLLAAGGGLIVVPVLGILAAIAIPSFVRARDVSQRNACVNNLRLLDAAKEQYALEHNRADGQAVTEADLLPYLPQGPVACPAGGTYTLNAIGEEPECSRHGTLSDSYTVQAATRPEVQPVAVPVPGPPVRGPP